MRIGIVNDSAFATEAIRRVILSHSNHSIAWCAADGLAAIDRCAVDLPDLLLMDMVMPAPNGPETLRRIMKSSPCPALVVTGSMDANCAKVFEAMGAGAIDAVNTPVAGDQASALDLIKKIDRIAFLAAPSISAPCPTSSSSEMVENPPLVVIGSSAGGPAALAVVLGDLPASFPAAILIAQHIDDRFCGDFAKWLDSQTPLSVRLGRKGDRPQAGSVLIASGPQHLIVQPNQFLGLASLPLTPYMPSINELFLSAAANWRGRAIGVILTGMGSDGASGLKVLRDAGHPTIAQDEASSALYGMPKAAALCGAAAQILPLDEISTRLKQLVEQRITKNLCP